jgi:hypothetical protein
MRGGGMRGGSIHGGDMRGGGGMQGGGGDGHGHGGHGDAGAAIPPWNTTITIISTEWHASACSIGGLGRPYS